MILSCSVSQQKVHCCGILQLFVNLGLYSAEHEMDGPIIIGAKLSFTELISLNFATHSNGGRGL